MSGDQRIRAVGSDALSSPEKVSVGQEEKENKALGASLESSVSLVSQPQL